MPPPSTPCCAIMAESGPPERHRRAPAFVGAPEDLPAVHLEPIGVVRSPFRYLHDAPRQPRVRAAAAGRIELRRGMQNCLADLQGFARIWVLFQFHQARGWREQLQPPRDRRKRGVFATRAPHRPNALGMSCVRLHEVRGVELHISDHDLLDGTPVLDLKPYLPYCDAFPDAETGYVAELPEDGPDHRWV